MSNKVHHKIKNCIYIYLYKQEITDMLGHYQHNHSQSYTDLRINKQTNNQMCLGFNFPTDRQDVMYSIWESYKKVSYVRVPSGISQERNKAVLLMMQCHKIMKLPIQTLFLATSVFDKVLNTNYRLNQTQSKNELNFDILGIACLYSCQKLEKIRNYGVSHWLKHLCLQNLSAIGYHNIGLSPDSLKKYEAYIMQKMNYNLFSSTLFDIVLGIWTLKIPTEKQFYFSQYLLELSLFCQLGYSKKQCYIGTSTVQSLGQTVQGEQTQKIQNILIIDIAIAIGNLSSFFFGKQQYSSQFLIKLIWNQYQQEINHKQLQLKKKVIKNISNQLFEKVLNIETNLFTKKIVQKYAKNTNYGISTFKFFNRSNFKIKNPFPNQNINIQILKHSQSMKTVTSNKLAYRDYQQNKIEQEKNQSLNQINFRSI